MKKLIISILILSVFCINANFIVSDKVYAQGSFTQHEKIQKKHLTELTRIQNQIYILSTNALKAVIDDKDKESVLKDVEFIRMQINSLTNELSNYHKTENGNIEKNPMALALLNTSNHYSISLSYLKCFLNAYDESDGNKCLENYYFSKGLGDQTLLWVKSQIK